LTSIVEIDEGISRKKTLPTSRVKKNWSQKHGYGEGVVTEEWGKKKRLNSPSKGDLETKCRTSLERSSAYDYRTKKKTGSTNLDMRNENP